MNETQMRSKAQIFAYSVPETFYHAKIHHIDDEVIVVSNSPDFVRHMQDVMAKDIRPLA